jgi:3alpha(or 20beta)-hydroxysteroid dehydrogenase
MSSVYPTGTRLLGKVALISGGGRGLGASHARAIVAQGGKVALGDIAQCDAEGKKLVEELGTDSAVYFRLDVRDRAQWKEAVATTLEKFGILTF